MSRKYTAPQKPPQTSPAPPSAPVAPPVLTFPVVGMGALAGALAAFFAGAPADTGPGMAFLNGTMELPAPGEPRGQRLPMDFFLRSLALDPHERAIGGGMP